MTREQTTEQRLTDWLVSEAPTELADRVLVETFEQTSATRQVRALPGWRTFPMDRKVISFAAGAAAIAVVVIAGAAYFGQPDASGVGGAPTPSPTPTPVASAAASSPPSIGTVGWVAFSSDRYGYDIAHPANWTATQADREWSFEVDQKDWRTTAADSLLGPAGPRFTVFAVDVPSGMSSAEWIASYHGPDAQGSPGPCSRVPLDLETTSVDGQPVEFWLEEDSATCGGAAGFVFTDGRVHVFTIWLSGQEPMLEALLSSVAFRP